MRTFTIWPVFSVLLCGSFWLRTEAAGGTDYERPGDWHLLRQIGDSNITAENNFCGQRTSTEKQSPINIVYENAVYKTRAELPHIDFNYKNSDAPFNVTYAGDGGGFTVSESQRSSFIFNGGNLPADYHLLQFHFHTESEHTKESEKALMEIHLVHYNADMSDNPKITPLGLAVFGIMFELGPPNVFLADLLAKIEGKPYDHDHARRLTAEVRDAPIVTLEFPHMSGLFPDDAETRFYSYDGSLTTPPCNEVVTWFVAQTRQTMSIEQFIAINRIHASSTTNRPVQPQNDREVRRTFIGDTQPIISMSASAGFMAPVYSASVYFLFSVSMVISALVF